MKTFEGGSVEQEPNLESKVILEFIHHTEKKKKDPSDPKKDLTLTSKGRKDAIEVGEDLDPNAEVSLAWGSSKKRSGETALLIMLANEDINADMKMEEVEAAIEAELGPNKKKLIEDPRLDFKLDGPGIGKWSSALYKEGAKFMPTYVKESDVRALETNDRENDTYTRKAAEIAEIILRYVKVGNTFNRIVSKSGKYEDNGNQLERYLGTHGTVIEPLVAKVVEKLKGVVARDELSEVLGKGFAQAKGFRVEIVNRGLEQEILLSYEVDNQREEMSITVDLLEEIIQDRDEFEKKFDVDTEK